MALPKLIQYLNGVLTEVIVGITTSTGASDADKLVATGADGRIDNSFMPVGIGDDTQVVVASENLAAGDLVNIWDDSGTAKVRKADATTAGKEAHGFVLSAFSATANATVYFEGTNTALSGRIPGKQYLATTAGLTTSTPPSGSGNVVQLVGFATSATTMNFQSGTPVILA